MPCLDENRLAPLIAGELPAAERALVEDHVAGCGRCREAIAELARTVSIDSDDEEETPPQGRGAAVGRYVLVEPIGSGGMGRVYAAYDSELDRKVAVKLLRPSVASSADAMREARAMAKVSHPHVVAVHDVGTFGERVFLAMELVDGCTLKEWLREPRGWRQVLDVFIGAADGLAAAHQAGVVHRDFKPTNVLIDRAGRARVTDFGLARVLALEAPGTFDPTALHSTAVGTPAYMSPEVMIGATADARSDQFSFCLTLYEALAGHRPFPGRSTGELAQQIRAGVPAVPKIPARVLRVLRRGLQLSPEARYPGMAALAAELRRAARPFPKLPFALAAAGLALAAAFGARQLAESRAVEACVGDGGQLGPAWGPERRGQLREAFIGTGRPFAQFAFAQTSDALDAWAVEWHTTRRSACEAALVYGETSREVLASTLRCLEQHGAELAALTQVMAGADSALVERSTAATYALPRPARCLQRTAAIGSRPDPESEAALKGALGKLAQASGMLYAARYAPALPLAAEAAALAHRSGDTRVEATALTTLGDLQQKTGAYPEAEATFERAIDVGLLNGLEPVTAEAWVRLTFVVGVDRGRPADGEKIAARAESALRGIGGSPRLEARLATARAAMLLDAGKYEESARQAKRSLELYVASVGQNHPDAIVARSNVGATLPWLGRHDEALEYADAAHRLALALYGPDHPRIASTFSVLAAAHEAKGDYALAAGEYEQALGIRERALGREHPLLHALLVNHCEILGTRLGRFDEAEAECRRSLAIAERTTGVDSRRAAQSRYTLGHVLLARGAPAQAQPELTRARTTYEKLSPEGHASVPEMMVAEAEAFEALGRLQPARELLDRAAPLAQRFDDGFTLGRVHLAQARLTWPSDRARARALAAQSRSDFEKSRHAAKEELAQLAAWVAAH